MRLAAALELSILFVCLWGFVAILLTGEFAAPVVILCMGALLAGYFIRRKGWRASTLVSNIAAIVVFGVAATIFATTYNLLSATVHLFLFLQVTKYITRKATSENRWCYVISLFNIIGASVITTTVTFGPVLLTYVFLMLISLRLYVMMRDWERVGAYQKSRLEKTRGVAADSPRRAAPGGAGGRGALDRRGFLDALFRRNGDQRPSGASLEHAEGRPEKERRGPVSPFVPRGILVSGVVFTLTTIAMSGALFSVIPRLATQNLFQNYGHSQDEASVSAFSEDVEFGAFTEIQQDNRIALFVQPVERDRPDHVRMRGVALDTFDGKSWRRSSRSFTRSGDHIYQPGFTTRKYDTDYKFRILQPAGVTRYIFGDSFPLRLSINPNLIYTVDQMSQSVSLLEMPPKEIQYEVESMHEDLNARVDPVTLPNPGRPASFLQIQGPVETQDDDDSEDNEDFGKPFRTQWMLNVMQQIRSAAQETTPTDAGAEADEDAAVEDDGEGYDPTPLADDGGASITGQIPEEAEDSQEQPDALSASEADYEERFQSWRARQQRPRTSGRERLENYLEKCGEVPGALRGGRISALAAQWTEGQHTTFSKAIAIERHLRTEFGYSLRPRATGNYIESFLFDVREGHCEYFATSMAVLLRNLGIPARIVNGFYSTEWNPLSGNFTVRQKDAHSWVEAWMGDSYGWMTFDPTPASGVGRRFARNAILEAISRVGDAMRMRWYRYIIDYSFSDQVQILRTMAGWRNHMQQFLRDLSITGVTSQDAQTVEQDRYGDLVDWRPLAFSGGVIFALVVWQVVRWLRRRRECRFASVRFYDELLRLLARRGLNIHPGETPREFAVRVAETEPLWSDFVEATEYYYHALYDQRVPGLSGEKGLAMNQVLASLRKNLRRTPGA